MSETTATRDGGVSRSVASTLDIERLVELARALVERNAQLEQALQSRIVIEQAKGVLVERFGVAPEEAFQLLRRGARTHRMRIHVLAAEVVGTRETPPQLRNLV